jgi:anaerobic ribonucleoside-triphosphate reductase activating protein
MRISGITYESFVDGPGLRVVIFAQGCDIGCFNCHNKDSWDASGGEEYTPRELVRKIKKNRQGSKEITRGVTFSGGEPFMQAADFALVGKLAKREGWDVATYTGHTYEALAQRASDEGVQDLLTLTDYLIDGPYIHEERDLDLRFRGSGNQRIIDMNATRKNGGEVVLYKES